MSNWVNSSTTAGSSTEASAPSVVVLGGEAAKGLASHLHEGYDVALLSSDDEVVEAADRAGLDAWCVDIISGSELEPRAKDAEAAVVAAERDRKSLLAAQLLNTTCDVERVVVRLNDPDHREIFRETDVELLEPQPTLGSQVQRTLFDEST